MREKIIKITEEILLATAKRCQAPQYQSKDSVYANPHKIRCTYLNAYSSLLRSYNQLLKDKELDEIIKELETLREDFYG